MIQPGYRRRKGVKSGTGGGGAKSSQQGGQGLAIAGWPARGWPAAGWGAAPKEAAATKRGRQPAMKGRGGGGDGEEGA